jgi:hypothetical protein
MQSRAFTTQGKSLAFWAERHQARAKVGQSHKREFDNAAVRPLQFSDPARRSRFHSFMADLVIARPEFIAHPRRFEWTEAPGRLPLP